MIIEARTPFDFSKSLAFVESFAPAGGEQLCGDQHLRKAFEIDGVCVLTSVYGVDDATLDVWLDADVELSPSQCAAAYDRVRFYLSLDDDVPPHPLARGFHQVKFATPFEATCWAILTQRLAIPIARRIKDRIRDRYGLSIERDGTVFRAFPSASRLQDVDDTALSALGVPAPKRRYLLSAIEAFGRIDERWLRSAPVDEVNLWLRAIAGIGHWSARLVLVRGLGRMDDAAYAHFYECAVPAILARRAAG